MKNPEGAHAGDFPNMMIAKDGSGRFEALTDMITLGSGPTSLFDSDGSAVVVHAGVDDYTTDPTGNAGDRSACGVVALTEEMLLVLHTGVRLCILPGRFRLFDST